MIHRAIAFAAIVLPSCPSSSFSQNSPPIPKAPPGFTASIFAQPPQVNYPVCLTAAPSGEVFIGIDKQGSLGKKPGQGRVVRCVDTNGDGKADVVNTFAEMDHPRGLMYDNGKLWVLHPPNLTLYHDDDGDGKADRKETLVTGLTTDFLKKRGADHTTNGIRTGIDGWIYIAVGDFGFVNAKGKDGRTLTLRGGGVVRVRPDGTEMEIFARGLRNILDVCIDPQLNMFTRDNTNDGGGWNIRVSHIIQSAHYGYPSLFKNFADEIMPPLADYGGGSGCGAMYVGEPWLPEKYRSALLTCDWGRNEVFFNPVTRVGPTYKVAQERFISLERPTDIDVDGRGRIYVSSWRGGQFNYKDENVGYVVQLKPTHATPPAFPVLTNLSDADLAARLQSASHVERFHVQREILRRGPKDAFGDLLKRLIGGKKSIDVRVAALFTYKQLFGAKANKSLVAYAADPLLREFVLRALTDRKSQMDGVPVQLFVDALKDQNPRVQLAAVIGLARLGKAETASAILPLADRPKKATEPKAFRVAVKKKQLVDIKVDICDAKKLFLVVTESANGTGWDHADWIEPRLVGPKGEKKLTDLKWTSAKAGWGGVYVDRNCQDKPMRVRGKPVAFGIGTHSYSVIAYDLPKGFDTFHAKGALDDSSGGRGSVSFMVFRDRMPETLEATSNPARVLPHVAVQSLVALRAVDACLQALDGPHRDGALWALRYMHVPKAVNGLIATLDVADSRLRLEVLQTLLRLYHREAEYKGSWWGTRPDTTGPYYDRVPWSETGKIEAVLRKHLITLADGDSVKTLLSELARHRVTLKNLPSNLVLKASTRKPTPAIAVNIPNFDPKNPNHIGNIPYERILKTASLLRGDPKLGAKLFRQQSCFACHTVEKDKAPVGPQLLDIGKRYKRPQLLESILKPNAQIAQGFGTNVLLMQDGKFFTGFVVREAADEVEIRTSKGESQLLPKNQIAKRGESKISAMPEGLVRNLTVAELASLAAYLESLRSEPKE